MPTTINPSDQTITQYNIQTGGASNLLNNVAPSATSGVPVISQGSSSQPIFGTAVVAGGGTGAVSLTGVLTGNGTSAVTANTVTQHGVVVGGASNAVTSTGVGSTGQVLQANTGADPTYSTATFPSTATGTGKILIADGTNWIASTPTYPSTAGTSGNVLTSNGTNWVSSAASNASGYITVTGSLTNSQIKNLHGTPITLVSAPGVGFIILPILAYAKFNYGGNNAFTTGANQNITLYLSTSFNTTIVLLSPTQLTTTTSQYFGNENAANNVVTGAENQALILYNTSATEIAGNAANNNTIAYSITYIILNI
jgi:hypothetical protein